MANDNVTTQIEEVLARAAVDDDFRKGLLTDPRTTLQAMADYVLLENLRVKFIEKSSDCDVLFVLPDPASAGELSAEELEAVAGGIFVGGPATIWDPTGGNTWKGR